MRRLWRREEIRSMVVVAITQNFVIEQAITEALRHLELEALMRGKRVAVKPK
jgi:hypothetical protein